MRGAAPGEGADEFRELRRRLSRAVSQRELMAIVSQWVRAALHADGATFVLREGDRCHYADEDAISPLWKGRRFPMSACISGWSMANRQSVAVPDIYCDPRIPAEAYRPTFVRSLAIVPVGLESPVAALGAYWSEVRQPQLAQLERLQAIADVVAPELLRLQASPRPDEALAAPVAPQGSPAPDNGPAPVAAAHSRVPLGGLLQNLQILVSGRLRRNWLGGCALAVLCILAATLVRLGVWYSGLHGLSVFSTYYPAILVAVLLGGRRAGVLAAVLGGLAAFSFFMPPFRQLPSPFVNGALDLALYGGASALIIVIIDWYQRAVLRLRFEDAEHLTLARELQHRALNALVVVETIVRQSLADNPAQARLLNQRIRAGFADIKIDVPTPATALRALLREELEPYGLANFDFAGTGDVRLAPSITRLLTLAVHELATNSLKHGALSTPEGRVAVSWRIAGGNIGLHWKESGGPRVAPPSRRGYGSILLQRLVQANGGSLQIDFPPAGVTAHIEIPLRATRQAGAQR